MFLSNHPESLSASSGLRKAGRSTVWTIGLSGSSSRPVCALATLLAFALLDDSQQNLIAFTLSFAAGAILAMLASTMMPEAFEHSGRAVALVTVVGFALGFAITEREASSESAPALEGGLVAGAEDAGLDLRRASPRSCSENSSAGCSMACGVPRSPLCAG